MKCRYPTVDQMHHMFVYLMDGSKPICYWKGEVKDFINPDPSY